MDYNSRLIISPEHYASKVDQQRRMNYLKKHPLPCAALVAAILPVDAAFHVGKFGARKVFSSLSNNTRYLSNLITGTPAGRSMPGYRVTGAQNQSSDKIQYCVKQAENIVGIGMACGALICPILYPAQALIIYGMLGSALVIDIAVNDTVKTVPDIYMKIRNYFDPDNCSPAPPTSLRDAINLINYWGRNGAAASDREFHAEQLLTSLTINEQQSLYHFLRKLIDTDEFNYSDTARVTASRRIINILSQSLSNPELREQTLALIHHSISDCNDHALLALSNLEAAIFLCQVDNNIVDYAPHTESYLRESARTMFFFDKVREYSLAFHERQPYPTGGGHIEVENAFHVLLRDSPNYRLPTTIQRVHSASKNTMPLITRQNIEDLKTYLDTAFSEEFEDYLQSWGPWKKYQRLLSVTPYNDLPTVPPGRDNNVCLISQNTPDQPVRLNGVLYDYSYLRKWYIIQGTDPLSGNRMIWNNVHKMVRPR